MRKGNCDTSSFRFSLFSSSNFLKPGRSFESVLCWSQREQKCFFSSLPESLGKNKWRKPKGCRSDGTEITPCPCQLSAVRRPKAPAPRRPNLPNGRKGKLQVNYSLKRVFHGMSPLCAGDGPFGLLAPAPAPPVASPQAEPAPRRGVGSGPATSAPAGSARHNRALPAEAQAHTVTPPAAARSRRRGVPTRQLPRDLEPSPCSSR